MQPDRTYRKPAAVPDQRDALDTPLNDTPAHDPWADWRRRLEDLLHDANLSDRSQTFLESLDEQLTEKGFLSVNQQAAIERIEEDRDGGRRHRY